MDSREVLRRFRHERQILAALEHPHIARLLDGGTTDDGLPYFVMEYVEGAPLDDYCDRHRLSTRERLKLFRDVCAAVHYAHQNLVVHRDLKPSNILVTAGGEVKLLDFGVAKLLDAETGGRTQTLPEVRLMTPDYASPEQVRGEAITTASDVYSLGVVLYELLTGRRPYRVKSHSFDEIVRVVCEGEPERPSTAAARPAETRGRDGATVPDAPQAGSRRRGGEAEKLRRQLAGDLDNIVLMALRKEPQRRYASAEQFSEDLRRHLAGLPVIAREDSFAYRAGKFVRRNRLAVSAAAAIAALLVAAVVVTLVQSARVARERDRAERERERAERVSAFLVDLFKVADPGESKGNTVTARELLDQGAERIAQELKDQPEAQATLMNTMGKAYHSLGLYDRAAALLEGALRTRRERLGGEHADVAESLHDLGLLLHDKGDYDRAEPLLRESLEVRRRLFGAEHAEVAASLNDLAVLLGSRRDYAAAEPLYREALEMRRRLLGGEHPDLAMNLNNLALLLQEKGDLDAAEPLQREALAMHRKLLGPDHPDLVPSLNNLALLLHRKRDYAGAEPLYREALELRRKLYGEEHPQVAFTTANLATLLADKGDHAAAEPLFRRSLGLRRKLLPAGHLHIGHSLLGLGRLLLERGEAAAAEQALGEAVAIFRAKLPPGNWMIADAESVLGGSLAARRRYAEAEPLLAASYSVLRDARGDSNLRTEQARERLIKLYEAWGKPEKAAPYRAAR
jgi:eukaryotic-like serine/threonine-protein kinase